MILQIEESGNYPVNGIAPGREFSLALFGVFDSATVKAQYPVTEPVRATLTLDDAESDAAIVLTAKEPGLAGNGITIEIVTPDEPDSPLFVEQEGLEFTISTATSKGDVATAVIGEGTNGTVTISTAELGTAANRFDVQVVAQTGNNRALNVFLSGSFARPRLIVELGTDSSGDPDNTKNTATLIRNAIHALPAFTAVASGTGADPVAVQAVTEFEGGGDNPFNTTTVGEVLGLFQTAIFLPHLTAALAEDADPDEEIAILSETPLADGTDGGFADFTGENEISFSAAGEVIGTNPGIFSTININVADAGGSTAIIANIVELPR